MTGPSAPVVVCSPASLEQLVQSLFIAAGATRENAAIVAGHLVLANLCGVDTHGVIHVPGYLDAIGEGRIDPGAQPTVDRETISSARVRADMATRPPRRSHSVAASRCCTRTPVAFAFPGGVLPGPAFDFATTAVAGMKVSEARRHGRSLPPVSIVDREGVPSDAPEVFYDGGAHLPFGGHKGYAIMVEAEWLGRIATGADEFAGGSRAEPVMRHQGAMGVFVKSDLFADAAQVAARSDEMTTRIRESEPARGVARVLLPGDPERMSRASRAVEGIPLDRDTLEGLIGRARQLNVPVPSELA